MANSKSKQKRVSMRRNIKAKLRRKRKKVIIAKLKKKK